MADASDLRAVRELDSALAAIVRNDLARFPRAITAHVVAFIIAARRLNILLTHPLADFRRHFLVRLLVRLLVLTQRDDDKRTQRHVSCHRARKLSGSYRVAIG